MTRIMVLGLLLKFGPMSGYEIQQKMQSAQTDKWAYVKPASIYHALKKLDIEKLVTLKTIEKTGNRSKAIYSITPLGEEEFNKLVVDVFKEPSVIFPTALYTGLTFFENTNTEEILAALDIQQLAIEKIYAEMKSGQEEKAKHLDIPLNVMLIFNNIYNQCELQLRFIHEMRQELLKQDLNQK